MRAALAVNRVGENIGENIHRIINQVHEASDSGADLVLFPEACLTGLINTDNPAADYSLGIEIPGKTTQMLCALARRKKIHIALGVLELHNNCLYDSALFITKTGQIACVYRRITPGWHSPNANRAFYRQGSDLDVFDTDFGEACFLICGDIFSDTLVEKTRSLKPDLLLFPFARSFDDYSADQTRWDSKEMPHYIKRIRRMGIPVLMANYLGDPEIADYCFGGAFALSSTGALLADLPLGKEGLLLVELDELWEDNSHTPNSKPNYFRMGGKQRYH